MMDAYDKGKAAAHEGVEFWRNPYTTPSSEVRNGTGWLAGWCQGMQEKAAAKVSLAKEQS
ncbi:MAG: hypothetical protein V4633_13445 [Pseudomonadota bacterium]